MSLLLVDFEVPNPFLIIYDVMVFSWFASKSPKPLPGVLIKKVILLRSFPSEE